MCRSSKKKSRDVNDDKRINAFEDGVLHLPPQEERMNVASHQDWRKNGSGPKMRLIDQVGIML